MTSIVKQYLAANAAAAKRFKGSKTAQRKSQTSNQALYRKRRENGLQPLKKPWDYLTCAEAKSMVWKAYRVASWHMREGVFEGRLSHKELREMFASSLAEMFSDALSAHAVQEGDCWPVDVHTEPFRDYPTIWAAHCEEVPDSWRPEYPFYSPVKAVKR
jgi:hypothetical protein